MSSSVNALDTISANDLYESFCDWYKVHYKGSRLLSMPLFSSDQQVQASGIGDVFEEHVRRSEVFQERREEAAFY